MLNKRVGVEPALLSFTDFMVALLLAALVIGSCRMLTDEPHGHLIPVTVNEP